MAETTPTLLLLPLMLLSFFLSTCYQQVHCFEHKAVLSLSLQKFQWKELKHVSECLPQQSRREKGATILEMKQKDYCSGHIKNWDETLQNRLVSDESRVKSMQTLIKNKMSSRIKGMSNSIQIPLKSGINLQTLNYIVTVELGGKNMTLLVDTGSDLTWIQCQPCVSCYDQQEPLFNPNISQSYRSITCKSTTCQTLSMSTGNPGVCGTDRRTCNYMVSYGDGSYSRGDLAREYLNLTGTAVPNFIFGCGRSNKGLFGGTSGIMGLGRSPLSLISQTSRMFKGIFSYCLPDNEDPGSLILGGNSSVYKNSTPITYTRMISDPQLSNFYLLNLTGMTIGGVNLQASFNSSGIIIDSGTVITRLVPSVYRALKTEFLKQFSGYPPAPTFSILDTCFNLTAYEELDIPVIRFGFEGSVQMTVDVIGMFYFVKADASQVCLALTSLSYEDDIGIIGNWQQRNQRIVYNTNKSKLGFAKEICN
ncbi:Aspartyl protease family protein [Thalictrum thalictroides]|uniref:Aspartyl protease family protein n=1 Tax=Thalictrum thalictroides TaxID=46969 RepID=A0A7J6WH10_THATH|nr:Aspartyl protease family protein [Thalictrum thalictroides]